MPKAKPSVYIPTLYFASGLPYTIVNLMSVVFFKSMGASNQFIGLTSLLYIPWTIKLFWAPLVDLLASKRKWILICHLVLAAFISLVALTTAGPFALTASLIGFTFIGLASATQDVAIDGYYLDALNKEEQAFYVGIRNAAYKVAWLFGAGGLVYLAGKLGEHLAVNLGWSVSFAVCAVIFFALFVLHVYFLPQPIAVRRAEKSTAKFFLEAFATYFKQKSIFVIVTYILIFRLGDALMLKMAQPFLLDPLERGGLGLTTADVGLIYGTVGMLFLLAGGLVGGFLVAKGGLKTWLLPTAIIQNSAILLYYLLAKFQPAVPYVYAVNSIEQFSYGLGVSAYTVFLLRTVKPEFKAAHYATATALMGLGVMMPGAVSGYLASALGYANFFLLAFVLAVPGFITIFFLPLDNNA